MIAGVHHIHVRRLVAVRVFIQDGLQLLRLLQDTKISLVVQSVFSRLFTTFCCGVVIEQWGVLQHRPHPASLLGLLLLSRALFFH
jgi:hypothetical protein